MDEKISFVFDGKIASEHQMDFYEAARFQYSASRLLVKLENFRKTGEFPKKISYKNAPEIRILPARPGSFGLDIIAPAIAMGTPLLLEVPIGALFSYVIDRIFRPGDDEAIREALATNRELVEVFDRTIAGKDDTIDRTLNLLQDRIEKADQLNDKIAALYERLIADQNRREQLQEFRPEFRKIGEGQNADLITMSAPLLKEMNVPLRRSARSVTVRTTQNDRPRDILRASKEMADAVDLAVVDRHISTIDINIVQFNKNNGWGKFENREWKGTPSFQIPGDMIDDMKQTVLVAMNKDLVEVDCYFVRSPAGVPQRIIVFDVNSIDEY
ncbi:hypothetical protein HKD42_03520 [Altererythrobacter sp. RZ02]|uniref:Uncharacterized protein n=1 Tax=Pontixanthobacter rizhaonensis TaxID=2730337 RepID=A0A848QJ84_9SPHN|nr:hypothetical protein [Pontixanthobacter rizhaonensis]NMW31124.1 hypothetical protein [Pontixanthobacter rizhaonensis]